MYSRKTMKSALESMMFMNGEPLAVKDAALILDASKSEVRELFLELQEEYEIQGRGIRIRETDDAFAFVTYIENDLFIKKLCTPVRIKKLSQAALEVLAIVAYKQPVSKGEIDSIRGIKSERVLDGLMYKGLIEAVGRSEGIGRPIIYGTTREFLAKFGFTSLDDLPEMEEFEDDSNIERQEINKQISLDFANDDSEGEIDEN